MGSLGKNLNEFITNFFFDTPDNIGYEHDGYKPVLEQIMELTENQLKLTSFRGLINEGKFDLEFEINNVKVNCIIDHSDFFDVQVLVEINKVISKINPKELRTFRSLSVAGYDLLIVFIDDQTENELIRNELIYCDPEVLKSIKMKFDFDALPVNLSEEIENSSWICNTGRVENDFFINELILINITKSGKNGAILGDCFNLNDDFTVKKAVGKIGGVIDNDMFFFRQVETNFAFNMVNNMGGCDSLKTYSLLSPVYITHFECVKKTQNVYEGNWGRIYPFTNNGRINIKKIDKKHIPNF
jgi:hypothetical protein